ncbi:MAG: zinc ribbon domain-containing protein [Clostridiales bacterium]|nr:zinc ribbon domain-containing protein [Clostridiales bacterium]
MPLITCPSCGAQISDKAEKCVYCGFDLSSTKATAANKCPECGTELETDATVCPNCGYPIRQKAEDGTSSESSFSTDGTIQEPPKNGKGKKLIAIIVIIAVIAVVIILAVIISNQRKERLEQEELEQQIEEYGQSISEITFAILSSASDAESAGGLIHDVWYNCINKQSDSETDKYTQKATGSYYSDFNDALTNLFSDSDFLANIVSLKSDQSDITSMMKDMQNPPEEWSEAYDALMDFYESYVTLSNLVISPSGSLMTYTSNFNDADSAVLDAYQKMKLYID